MKTVLKGTEFEKDVERILQLKGYTVTRNNLINGTQIDLHASKNDPLDNVSLIVECADREKTIGVDLVKEKSAILLTLRNESTLYRLLFVSRNGFTAEAKAFGNSQPNLLLVTFNELERLLVDLSPYVNSYIYNYERSLGIFKDANLINYYVPLSAKDSNGSIILSIDTYIEDWMTKADNNLIFLLGDYGSGKSSFCRQFVYKILNKKYVQNSNINQTPILINLRDSRGKLNLKQVVTDTLVNAYGVELSSYSAFERLCATGNIILVLDGFDEMSDRSDTQTLIDSFNQIYIMAALQTKIILTCRSNFFKSNEEIIELLKQFSISVPDKKNHQILEFSLSDQGNILYMEKLNGEQIKEFIKKRFGNKTQEIISTIKKIHDLSDLSTRPVLLDIILSTLPELEKSKKRINSAALYTYYTNRWTNRDQWRVSIPLKIRQIFCEIMAWVMHCAGITELPYNVLEKIILTALNELSIDKEQFEKFKNDIQTCSFLVRSGEEDVFRFAHKSFVEFFFSQKLINDLTNGLQTQKPNMEDWFPISRGKKYVVQEPFFNSGKNKNNLSIMLEYFRDAMNDRLRSHSSYHSLIEADFAAHWNSNASFHDYFESEIKSVFKNNLLASFSQEILISEEIATFSSELLFNLQLTFDELISKVSDIKSFDIICDILRLSKSTDWVSENIKSLKEYILKGSNDNLKTASISALIGQQENIDVEYIRTIRAKISDKGWSYTLFELSNKKDRYRKLIATLVKYDKLKPLDQAICLFGLSEQFPDEENYEKLSLLIIDLMKSDEEIEKNLALKVSYVLPEKIRIRTMTNAFSIADSKSFKKAIIKVLEETLNKNSWKLFRTLAMNETDPEIKKSLKITEQLLRNINSRQESRSGWSRIDGYKNIRNTIWKRI